MTYVVKNVVSKYVAITHGIKTLFELYKYHTYMWFHMNSSVLILWKEIVIQCVQVLFLNTHHKVLAEGRSNFCWC
jgi:hypothetical protein